MKLEKLTGRNKVIIRKFPEKKWQMNKIKTAYNNVYSA
jgi:hypothetical protein